NIGVPDPAYNDALVACQFRPFQLHGVDRFRKELSAANPNRHVVDRFKSCIRQVKSSRTLAMQERVSVFVQAVSRNALRSAAQAISIWADCNLVVTHSSRDHAFAKRFTDQGAALGHFTGMPRQPGWESAHDRDRRKESRIAAASSQNKIRAVTDRLLERLHAHHAYDATAAIDDVVADGRRRVQRDDAFMPE